MVGVSGVLKNTKVQKTKFKKKSEAFDQYDHEQHESHNKMKHHDKAMYRMLKDERADDAEY